MYLNKAAEVKKNVVDSGLFPRPTHREVVAFFLGGLLALEEDISRSLKECNGINTGIHPGLIFAHVSRDINRKLQIDRPCFTNSKQ